MGGRQDYDTLVITGDQVQETRASLNPRDRSREPIDYVTLGCPHLHIDEIRTVAGYLEGKRIHPDTRVEIWTTGPFRYMAERSGYLGTIQEAGAHLLTGSCPSSRGYARDFTAVAFDSAKQRYAANQETRAKLFYGSREECLASALSGRWEGRS
jgi:predicted aconitase